MSFRVKGVEDVRITAIKVRFGGKLRSVWVRLHDHPLVGEFIPTLDHQEFCFTAPGGSSLTIKADDIADLELSAVIRYEFRDGEEENWHPSTDKPQARRLVLPVEAVVSQGDRLVETIEKRFGPP